MIPSSIGSDRGAARTQRTGLTLVAALLLAAASLGAPSAARADDRIGPYQEASVQCDHVYHTLLIQPIAGAAPGLAWQDISYRYYVRDVSANTFVEGWWPSTTASFRHNYQMTLWVPIWGEYPATMPGPVFGPGVVLSLVPGHSYAVFTEYLWPLTDGTFATVGVWTTRYGTSGGAFEVHGTADWYCQV